MNARFEGARFGLLCVLGLSSWAAGQVEPLLEFPPLPGSGPTRVTWVENGGQWPGEALYVARLGGSIVGAEPWAVLIERREEGSDRGVLVKLAFEGARMGIVPEGLEREPGGHNYFLGADPEAWCTGLSSFARVRYEDLYPGIDLILREGLGGLEYDLHLDPGADLSKVVLRCEGVESVRRGDDGALVLETALGALTQPVGRSFEVLPDGTTKPIDVGYRLLEGNRFGFEATARDPQHALVVDPELIWSTYLGGTGGGNIGDVAWAVAVGPNGDVTVATETSDWASFPLTPGAFKATGGVGGVVVTRLDAKRGYLVYSSVIGGFKEDRPEAIAVDSSERAAVAGWTFSNDFPVTPGAFDTFKNTSSGKISAFVLRLSAAGDTLEYSTFLEGSNGSKAFGVALLDTGHAIVGGEAYSGDFPVTAGAFQTVHSGTSSYEGFITRLDPTGSSLEWSTFLGGVRADRIYALAADVAGTVTVAGETSSLDFPLTPGAFDTNLVLYDTDAFATRLTADGSSLVWSTYLGGKALDEAVALALEPSGVAAVGGWTYSADYPTTPGAFQQFTPSSAGWGDGFATRIAPDGTALIASTCIGSDREELVEGIAVDASGMVSVVVDAGDTNTFPTTPGAFNTIPTNTDDLAVCRFDPGMTRLLYSTLLGGPVTDSAKAVAMSSTRRVTAVGRAFGSGYPTTSGSLSPMFNGGTADAVITTFDLVLEGIELIGHSKPACLGPIAMNATEMPAAGAASFAFYASGAPPNASGWLVVGGAGPSLVQPFGGPSASRIIPVQADAQGYVETPYPLSSASPGETLHARYAFRNPTSCPGQGAWSTSNALRVTVQ